jgi:ferrochelatase
MKYDAILVISFGGPEGPSDVMPFLENVTRGRDVPRERLLEVAEHYYQLGGVSPIQEQVRSLIAALEIELRAHGRMLPIYWGNRNWHPMLDETVQRMKADGISRALAFVTSPWSSYSGCRQYLEAIANARATVGEGAPRIEKIRPYFDHPGFLEAQVERVREALAPLPSSETPHLLFTAHSIPISMAQTSAYEAQVREASRIVAERAAPSSSWDLVWQSRSGPPHVPWLEPDIRDALSAFPDRKRPIVIVPIGFISDHVEVVWDLDHDARTRADELGINFIRASTVGTHPLFVRGIRELIEERLIDGPKRSLSVLGPCPDICAEDCCPAPPRRART